MLGFGFSHSDLTQRVSGDQKFPSILRSNKKGVHIPALGESARGGGWEGKGAAEKTIYGRTATGIEQGKETDERPGPDVDLKLTIVSEHPIY